MEDNNDDRRKKIQQSELVLVGFLFLFAIGSIVFGVVRLKDSIRKPFQIVDVPEQSANLLDGVDRGGVDIEGLKSKDTDGDGLNDYQETYITQTSVFLADTDGDTVSDKEEIARGTNPNCPEGKTCFQGSEVTKTPIDASLPTSQSGTIDPTKAQMGAGVDPKQEVNKVLQQFQNKTPQQIREFLKEQGIAEDQLSKIPDSLLQSMYSQGLEKAVKQIQEKGLTGETNTQQKGVAVSPPDPSLLTSQEIRTLLEASGKVPLDILKKVPDSALKDIFLKATQSVKEQK